jgi:hypothetical protein
MRIGAAFGWAILGSLVIVACGSSSSDGGTTAGICTPGASVACTGAGGCSGGQVCNQAGTALGDCTCGVGTDSGPPSDSGPPIDSGVDSGPFSPASLSGLLLWVSGDHFADAGTTTITDWPDRSGAGHDLVSQVAGDGPAEVSGTANFTQASDTAIGAASSAFAIGSDNFVVELVVTPMDCSGLTCGLVLLTDQTSELDSLKLDTQLSGSFQSTATPDKASVSLSAAQHVIALRRTSLTAGEVRVDGTATAIAFATTHNVSKSGIAELVLGVDSDFPTGSFGTVLFYGANDFVAEAVVVHNPSDADVTSLEAYLKSKYGL